jgi:hypothetical protein
VSVNGGAFSTSGTQSPCVTPGSITLEAKPASGTFELGPDPWLYVSGTGGTDAGISGTVSGGVSSTAVVVGSSAGCVLVCCPFSSDGTGCDAAFSGFTTFTKNCP